MIELNKLKSGQMICKLHGSLDQITSIYKFLGYDEETKIVLMQKIGANDQISICRMQWKQEEWTLFPKKFLKFLSKSSSTTKQKDTGDMNAEQEGTGEMTAEKFFGKVDEEDIKDPQPKIKVPKQNLSVAPPLPSPPTEEGQGGGRGHWS